MPPGNQCRLASSNCDDSFRGRNGHHRSLRTCLLHSSVVAKSSLWEPTGFGARRAPMDRFVVRLSLLLITHHSMYTKVRTLSNINFRAIRIARSSRRASLPRPIRLPAVLGLCIQEKPSLWDFDSLGSYPRKDYIPPFGICCLLRARNGHMPSWGSADLEWKITLFPTYFHLAPC